MASSAKMEQWIFTGGKANSSAIWLFLSEAASIKNSAIAEELALPPVKIHCSILAEDAIKAAVDDYKKRHGQAA